MVRREGTDLHWNANDKDRKERKLENHHLVTIIIIKDLLR